VGILKVQVGGQESRNIFPQANREEAFPQSANPPSPLKLPQISCKYMKIREIANDTNGEFKKRRQAAG
jgi:hypothetical protein